MANKKINPAKPVKPEKLSKARKPEINLYLEKINQEMIRNPHTSSGKCDYYASWEKSCCVLDFSLVRPGDLVSNPMQGLIMRKDGEGGLMWNPRTGSVYKLNETAYNALVDLESGHNEGEIAKRNNLELPEVTAMVNKLRSIAK